VGIALSQLLQRMLAKRPNDRPEWDEVLKVLASSEEILAKPSVAGPAVEAAIKLQQQQEKEHLAAQEAAERQIRATELYQYSCEELARSFDQIVEEFNAHYQHGKILMEKPRGDGREYHLPTGGAIVCSFFYAKETNIIIRGRQLVGGGILGIRRGVSANLLLLRQTPDDLYGIWLGCLVKPGALVDPRRLIGTRGITPETGIPFGFTHAADFYEEMRWAPGTAQHVFTYEIRDDVGALFSDFLETAFNPPPPEMVIRRER
jgi:hypothetical protein